MEILDKNNENNLLSKEIINETMKLVKNTLQCSESDCSRFSTRCSNRRAAATAKCSTLVAAAAAAKAKANTKP